MNKKTIEHLVERCNFRQMDLENKTIFSRDAMTFHNLGNSLRQRRDLWEMSGKWPDPDKSSYLVTESLWIYFEPIPGDQAALFQAKNAFFCGWIGHPNFSGKLCDRHPGLLLKQAHYFNIFVISGDFFNIHRLITDNTLI